MSTSAMPTVARVRLRLTRRGRAVIALLVSLPIALALIGLSLNGGGATATSVSSASSQSTVTTVTVEAGQSLWAVASVIAPSSPTADVVADLMAINALESASVQPGQQLIVPERYVD
jgi:LysM repeat protein